MTQIVQPRHRHGNAGFTIIEMMIAVGIMMAVMGATFSLMNPAQGVFQAQPELMDMQQRLRVGTDILYKDLLMAGAGQYSGSMTGSLGNYFAPILPYRVGNVSPDPVGSPVSDRVSVPMKTGRDSRSPAIRAPSTTKAGRRMRI